VSCREATLIRPFFVHIWKNGRAREDDELHDWYATARHFNVVDRVSMRQGSLIPALLITQSIMSYFLRISGS
jgi:hypothetical protein